MELSSFTEESKKKQHSPLSASANAEGKDGSKRWFCCVARVFLFFVFFLFLDLVPEEPTKTVIVWTSIH